jgi:D-glycero-alpha-D-manno-heptose 1-phosphate guanylyltransferase
MSDALPRVLILAGGFGTRLQTVVKDRPKPMALIQGRPLLEYQIEYLSKQGFKNFTLLTGYMSEVIREHFKNGKKFGVKIQYSHEDSPLGTGGAIRQAIETCSDQRFLVLNGDGLFATDYRRFNRLATQPLSVALKFTEDLSRYGSVEIDDSYRITHFREKDPTRNEGFINSGAYCIERSALSLMPQGKFSIETDVFEPLSHKREIQGVPCGGKFVDIGIPEAFQWAQDQVPEWIKEKFKPCLFLDRDGVLIKHIAYMHKPEEVELTPAVVDLLKFAQDKSWWKVVVTNQAGVARGYFAADDCEQVHREIERQLAAKGITLDAWHSCFTHPEGSVKELRRESLLRKPGPGMVLKACEQFPIDLSRSLMIGDNVSDQLQIPDLKTYLIQGDFPLDSLKPGNLKFETFDDLIAAAKPVVGAAGAPN